MSSAFRFAFGDGVGGTPVGVSTWEGSLEREGLTRLAFQHLFDSGKPHLELAHVPPEEDVLR